AGFERLAVPAVQEVVEAHTAGRLQRAYPAAGGMSLRLRCRWGLRRFFLEKRLAAQPDLAGRIDVDHLHEELFAFLELVADVLYAMVGDFRNVEEAIGPGHDLDEGAEVGDALNLAEVGFVELGCRRQLLNDRDRFLS